MSAEVWFAIVLVLFFAFVSVMVLGFILLLIYTNDKVAKFFSSNPDVNEFEELRKSGK